MLVALAAPKVKFQAVIHAVRLHKVPHQGFLLAALHHLLCLVHAVLAACRAPALAAFPLVVAVLAAHLVTHAASILPVFLQSVVIQAAFHVAVHHLPLQVLAVHLVPRALVRATYLKAPAV